jgi:NAD(P)H-dependent glutamate synthase small subunit
MRVAVVGSGPAGLAAAQQLARKGHDVTVFEQDEQVGGILRYGIPDFKLEKQILDRRLDQMHAEGVSFETGVSVGTDISIRYLRRSFNAVLLAGGARVPRDLNVPGRDLDGVHFAMEFLVRQNRSNAGESADGTDILATGKNVVIIGGGDTGSDCLGTSIRQKALSVRQFEIMPKPPPTRDDATPWPMWPNQLRTSTSHEEGGERRWCILTKEFRGVDGHVTGLLATEVEWDKGADGRMTFREIPDTEFEVPADLVLLAMGFTREGNADVLEGFGLEIGEDGNVVVDDAGMSTTPGVFVAGDLAEGASLVVRAIVAGRRSADGIDAYLKSVER